MLSRLVHCSNRASLLRSVRCFSSLQIDGPVLGRKISLSILNEEKNKDVKVLFEATWTNQAQITVEGLSEDMIEIERDGEELKPEENDLFVEFDANKAKGDVFIHVKVPEMIDLELESDILNIETKNKVSA